MRQYVLATTPGGRCHRWGEDEPRAENILSKLDDEDTVPGGYKTATGSLPRKPGVDYSDMQVGTKLEFFGAGHAKHGEYRLERAARLSGDYLTMDPAAFGYQGHLADDNSAQMVFVDGDVSGWGDVSAARRIELGFMAPVPVTTGFQDASATLPAIIFAYERLAEFWMGNEYSYYGGGCELGAIIFNFKGSGEDTAWQDIAYGCPADSGAGTTLSADFNAMPESGPYYLAFNAGTRYAGVQTARYQGAASINTYTGIHRWERPTIFGAHGCPIYGAWPNYGLLESDMLAFALARWAPLLNFTTGAFGTIKPTQFFIPQMAFKEPGPISEWIPQMNRFELKEWAVWNDQTFWLNDRGQREGRKRWRARIRPTQFKETGEALDRSWNGVVVLWQDVGGQTLAVGPTGSGYTRSTASLLDTDPQNPANQIEGERRWAKLQMKGVSTELGAIRAGEKFLELTKQLDGSGSAVFNGYIEDEHGALWPYYCAHAGDVVDFVDSSLPGDRYVISCHRNRAERKAEITLDAPPQAMEALLEELDVELVGIGFG